MYGLSVRWSLIDAPPDTLDRLRDYVESESHAKFSGVEGLHLKVWRARAGEWFEGTYVFVDAKTRQDFQGEFTAKADSVPGTTMVGATPEIEPFEVVAVAEGPAGVRSAARFEA